MNETIVVEKKRPTTIGEMLESRKTDIAALLPTHVPVERFIKSALLAVARDNKLKNCTPLSVFTAVVNAAELGLDFTPAKGHAYLIPYGNTATFMPGYRGFIDLALRSGKVNQIWSYLVHENDEFSLVYGTNPTITHIPKVKGDRGKIIGAYAVARFPDGSIQFEYMDLTQLEKIRSVSKANNIGPWVSNTDEMQRKTTVRRLFKYIPSSPDIDKALEYDNAAVGIEDVEIDSNTSRTAQLAEIISPNEEQKSETTESEPSDKTETDADGLFRG